MENLIVENDFDGVFYFTNATNEDFEHLWNNQKYIYPAQTTCPMIISSESLENIQSIRKRFAYDLAVREFYKSKEYTKMSKMGNGLPPTFDDKVLQPWIDQCLKPLPKAKAKVVQMPKENDRAYKASKAVGQKDNLAYEFKDVNPDALGELPNSPQN